MVTEACITPLEVRDAALETLNVQWAKDEGMDLLPYVDDASTLSNARRLFPVRKLNLGSPEIRSFIPELKMTPSEMSLISIRLETWLLTMVLMLRNLVH